MFCLVLEVLIYRVTRVRSAAKQSCSGCSNVLKRLDIIFEHVGLNVVVSHLSSYNHISHHTLLVFLLFPNMTMRIYCWCFIRSFEDSPSQSTTACNHDVASSFLENIQNPDIRHLYCDFILDLRNPQQGITNPK